MPASSWQTQAAVQRAAVLESIPTSWRIVAPSPLPDDVTGVFMHQYLTPREVEITESLASDILARTTTGQWSATEVSKAFAHRTAVAHQLVPAVSETLFDSAFARAAELDAAFKAAGGKPVGPLHGLPISLKDTIRVRGAKSTPTVGFVDFGEQERSDAAKVLVSANDGAAKELVEEATIATLLIDLGAVPIAKTHVPQVSFAGETMSNLIPPLTADLARSLGLPIEPGYLMNPLRPNHLSPGGSSGGEAALLAMRGAPLGLGTDIGGSIRWPASNVGAVGLRPSTGRFPFRGIAAVGEGGRDSVTPVRFAVGPMVPGGDVKAATTLTRALLGSRPWERDADVVEIPWREELFQSVAKRARAGGVGEGARLVVGVIKSDGIVRPTPPVARAVDTVEKWLKDDGIEVVEVETPDHMLAVKLWYQAAFPDGAVRALAQFARSGETVHPAMPGNFLVDPAEAKDLPSSEVMDLNQAIRRFQDAYLDYWMATAAKTTSGRPIDVIVMPVSEAQSVRPGRMRWGVYSTTLNVLDFTGISIPVTKADRTVDVYSADWSPLGDIEQKVKEDYDPEIYHGMPVSIQIIGRRYHEEQVLAVAEYIDQLRDKHTPKDEARL